MVIPRNHIRCSDRWTQGLFCLSKPERQSQRSNESIVANPQPGHIQDTDHEVGADDGINGSVSNWSEIFLILASVAVCAPFGLILLWKSDRLDSKTKKVMALGYVCIVITILLAKFLLADFFV